MSWHLYQYWRTS